MEWRKSITWPMVEASDGADIRVIKTGTILKAKPNNAGYMKVTVETGFGKRDIWGNTPTKKKLSVHRIVADAWIGKCPSGKECHHKDHNKLNNVPSNLEYITHQQNLIEARKAGRFPDMSGVNSPRKGMVLPESWREKLSLAKRGDRHFRAVKPDVEAILELRRHGTWMPLIWEHLGLKRNVVMGVINGTHWSVRGEYIRRTTYRPVAVPSVD